MRTCAEPVSLALLLLLAVMPAWAAQPVATPYGEVSLPMQLHKVPDAPVYYLVGRSGVPGAGNEGHTSNAGFVVTDDGVVVFDALGTPALGYRMLQRIREVTDQRDVQRITVAVTRLVGRATRQILELGPERVSAQVRQVLAAVNPVGLETLVIEQAVRKRQGEIESKLNEPCLAGPGDRMTPASTAIQFRLGLVGVRGQPDLDVAPAFFSRHEDMALGNHAGLQEQLIALHHVRRLVRLNAQAVPRAVREIRAISSVLDHGARRAVHLLGGHARLDRRAPCRVGLPHHLIDLAQLVLELRLQALAAGALALIAAVAPWQVKAAGMVAEFNATGPAPPALAPTATAPYRAGPTPTTARPSGWRPHRP